MLGENIDGTLKSAVVLTAFSILIKTSLQKQTDISVKFLILFSRV